MSSVPGLFSTDRHQPLRPPPPLLPPHVFLATLCVLTGSCGDGANTHTQHQHQWQGQQLGMALRAEMVRLAAAVLALLPSVGCGDVLADGLLSGRAEACASRRTAAACGVRLARGDDYDYHGDDFDDDDFDDDDLDDDATTTSSSSAVIHDGSGGGATAATAQAVDASVVPFPCPTHSDPAAYLAALQQQIERLAGADTHGVTCLSILRTLLCVPAARDAFAVWNVIPAATTRGKQRGGSALSSLPPPRQREPMLARMFPARLLWPQPAAALDECHDNADDDDRCRACGDSFMKAAAAWEVLLVLFPPSTSASWPVSCLALAAATFEPLVLAVTAGTAAAAAVEEEAAAAVNRRANPTPAPTTASTPLPVEEGDGASVGRNERDNGSSVVSSRPSPTALMYAMVLLTALIEAAVADRRHGSHRGGGSCTSTGSPTYTFAGGAATGDGGATTTAAAVAVAKAAAAYSGLALTSAAIACHCMDVLRRSGSGAGSSGIGSRGTVAPLSASCSPSPIPHCGGDGGASSSPGEDNDDGTPSAGTSSAWLASPLPLKPPPPPQPLHSRNERGCGSGALTTEATVALGVIAVMLTQGLDSASRADHGDDGGGVRGVGVTGSSCVVVGTNPNVNAIRAGMYTSAVATTATATDEYATVPLRYLLLTNKDALLDLLESIGAVATDDASRPHGGGDGYRHGADGRWRAMRTALVELEPLSDAEVAALVPYMQ